MSPSQKKPAWPWAVLLVFNTAVAVTSIILALKKPQHSLQNDDYPLEIPVDDHLDPVLMNIQDSVRYQLNLTDSESKKEWYAVISWPYGAGKIHLGEQDRLFNTVYHHQLHCVYIMAGAIQDRHYLSATDHHIKHCLQYLRQTLMCDADYTLEEGDFMIAHEKSDSIRGGDARVCRDWETLYNAMSRRIMEFKRKTHPKESASSLSAQ